MNRIGLNQQQSDELIVKMNDLLANYQIFYMNVRGFHWNIKGQKFFELHNKFEELYDDLLVKIDEIAERVLTLGGTPTHRFTDYLAEAELSEKKNITNGDEAVDVILNSFEKILKKQRTIVDISDVADDAGTSAIISDYIKEQEKLVWMYSAFLNKVLV